MTKLETILSEAASLSPAEQLQLVRFLMERLAGQPEGGEIAPDQAPLEPFPESPCAESWAPFYPVDLDGHGKADT